ncbi:MAG: polysaccharide biosynthesis tyrosine autokinase [Runella slithyformis]|nr:MAG: polysaccharide biosynthesis tyrosine autokinase [Runella slithyformis]
MQNDALKNTFDRYADGSATIDMKRLGRVLWSRWYWVVAAVGLALGGCFVFLKIAKPRYVASVTLRYSEKKTQIDELNQLIQPDGFNNQEYITEKYVIESEEVINKAIGKLNYPFTFYKENAFRRDDVYPYKPFTAEVISYVDEAFGNGNFEINQKGIITYKTENDSENKTFDIAKDTLIVVQGLTFKISSVAQLSDSYAFTYNALNIVKKSIDGKVSVSEAERNLPILEVSFSYYNKKFTQDFLEKLIESYQDYNLAQKKQSSELTIGFIRQQVGLYSSKLRQASSEVASYKQSNSVPNLQSSLSEVMAKMTDLETQKNTLDIQRSYVNLLESSLSNRLEPINIGNVGLDNTSDGVLVKLVNEMNKLLSDRKAMLMRSLSVNSPQIKGLDEAIEQVRDQILSNINVQKQKNEGTLRIVNENLSLLRQRVNALPSVERQLLYLESDRDVQGKIYMLLLNKEIEASIVKAGILPSFTVLTRSDSHKTYPKAIQVLLICLFAGLSLGIGSIFLVRFLNDKFTDVAKIGQKEQVNLLGIINRYPESVQNNETDIVNFLENRSLFSESINGIRTNLSAMTADIPGQQGKLLVVTSEISGEGKSFVTVNLAISLTKINKKVLIIVSDLRRSKLHRFFNNNNKVGLSNYLSGKIDDYKKVIGHSVIENLDYMTAGPVPFNPAELIQNPRFEAMIDACRAHYDVVIVDTAPVGLVSDNIPLLKRSDLVVFIVRWMYSSKESYLLPDQLAEEYNLKSVGVIVNDFYKDDLYTSLAPAAYYASRGHGYYYKNSYDYYGKSNSYYDTETTKKAWYVLPNWIKKITNRKP